MDNSPTGIGINRHPSEQGVLVFLDGGGGCFNQYSCDHTDHAHGYGAADLAADGISRWSIFRRDESRNIFRDYSFVWIPYCTGDSVAGAGDERDLGGSVRRFAGYVNMALFLQRLVHTFADAPQVVLAGVSAGGFGAFYNFDQVVQAFSPTPVMLIDDSGPWMAAPYVGSCLQQHFVSTWGMADTFPDGCDDCRADFGSGFMAALGEYYRANYPETRMALISSTADYIIREYWSFGLDDCSILSENYSAYYPPSLYSEGLNDLERRMGAPAGPLRIWSAHGARHGWITSEALWTEDENGVNLSDWLAQGLTGDPEWASATAPPLPLRINLTDDLGKRVARSLE